MKKSKILQEAVLNQIEHCNALDKGRLIPDNSLDIIICDPPLFKNQNDKVLNHWSNENSYIEWFRLFVNIVSTKMRKTGIFYLIGDLEEINSLFSIIQEFGYCLTSIYYFNKCKKNTNKKQKESIKLTKIIDVVAVFTKDFQKKVKKLLKLKQEECNKPSKDINMELSGNGNGGGYWSLYCGDNSKNIIPSEDHWNILKRILNINIEYEDILTQFKPYDGVNFWDDINMIDEKFGCVTNRPVEFYERLIKMNRKNPMEITVWDPFCGFANSTLACKKLGANFYANEFDLKTYYKSLINIGHILNVNKEYEVKEI